MGAAIVISIILLVAILVVLCFVLARINYLVPECVDSHIYKTYEAGFANWPHAPLGKLDIVLTLGAGKFTLVLTGTGGKSTTFTGKYTRNHKECLILLDTDSMKLTNEVEIHDTLQIGQKGNLVMKIMIANFCSDTNYSET